MILEKRNQTTGTAIPRVLDHHFKDKAVGHIVLIKESNIHPASEIVLSNSVIKHTLKTYDLGAWDRATKIAFIKLP